ncbi:MAG TPA: hypothetical protein VI942_00430, partial [Thermoanaerobaculia bacterium]|nr:hypothetical protein [Thermoanaerobaculia bacterium]
MRDRRAELAGLLVIALLGSAAVLSRNPEGVVVERAKRWPLVGPLAARFQDRFRAPRPPAPPPAEAPAEIVVLRFELPEPPESLGADGRREAPRPAPRT